MKIHVHKKNNEHILVNNTVLRDINVQKTRWDKKKVFVKIMP